MFYNETVVLPGNVEMPAIAAGTMGFSNARTSDIVYDAIKAGFRHIDTALLYGNELGVGHGIRRSGVSRQDIFVTTKLPAEVKSAEGVASCVRKSLDNLGTDYIDLLLIHAPTPWEELRGPKRFFRENMEAWSRMEDFCAEGSVRAIGVANFKDVDLDNIIRNAERCLPVVNQLKMYPGSSSGKIFKATVSRNIVPVAYSPLGGGSCFSNPVIADMSARYGVSPARLCLRYSLQRGCCPVVVSRKADHLRDCGELGFDISDEDMKTLSSLGVAGRLKRVSADHN